MKFYIHTSFWGGSIPIIEQAAQVCNAKLIAVQGYALADYPHNRDFVEGNVEYLFELERSTMKNAAISVVMDIHRTAGDIYSAQLRAQGERDGNSNILP